MQPTKAMRRIIDPLFFKLNTTVRWIFFFYVLNKTYIYLQVNEQIELRGSQIQSRMRNGCLKFLNDSRETELTEEKEAEKLKLLAAPSESIASQTQIWESAATCNLNPHNSCNYALHHFPVAQNTCAPKTKIANNANTMASESNSILNIATTTLEEKIEYLQHKQLQAEKTNGFNCGQYTFSNCDAEEADVDPDFSIRQGSCMSSVLSNSVIEAINFHELQDVMMEQVCYLFIMFIRVHYLCACVSVCVQLFVHNFSYFKLKKTNIFITNFATENYLVC